MGFFTRGKSPAKQSSSSATAATPPPRPTASPLPPDVTPTPDMLPRNATPDANEARRASREARLIKLAHARIPKPLTPETRGVELAWEVGALVVRADRASEILFYPKSECPDLIDPIRGALAHGERLTLSFKPDDDRGTVSGVIEVKLANQRYPRLYEIKIARPDTGG